MARAAASTRRTSAGHPGMYDLAVQDGKPASEFLGNGLRERFKCLERIPIARYQPAVAALDIGDSSKTIELMAQKSNPDARRAHRNVLTASE